MSDSLILAVIAIVCVTFVVVLAITLLGTYMKDKLLYSAKIKSKNIEAEIAVDSEDKESKK